MTRRTGSRRRYAHPRNVTHTTKHRRSQASAGLRAWILVVWISVMKSARRQRMVSSCCYPAGSPTQKPLFSIHAHKNGGRVPECTPVFIPIKFSALVWTYGCVLSLVGLGNTPSRVITVMPIRTMSVWIIGAINQGFSKYLIVAVVLLYHLTILWHLTKLAKPLRIVDRKNNRDKLSSHCFEDVIIEGFLNLRLHAVQEHFIDESSSQTRWNQHQEGRK